MPSDADCEAGSAAHVTPTELPPRQGLVHRCAVHVCDTFLDLYSAAVTFALYLVTFETLLLCVLSAGSVAFYCRWYTDKGACAATPVFA
jgi:hypothetical protein